MSFLFIDGLFPLKDFIAYFYFMVNYLISWLIIFHFLAIRSNFLHDLPSLDPELYRHLLFLKVKALLLVYLQC